MYTTKPEGLPLPVPPIPIFIDLTAETNDVIFERLIQKRKINLNNPPIHPLSNILIRCTPAYFRKKMDDSRKLRSIIEEIRNKEEKIKCLQRTRERDMSECRLRAHSAAELREQIR